ncbi:MAG: RNA-binding S4 domain-containing protein [Hyphomicrobium denitrificans]|nr:RNA-binding S4 domain-containing protein [Hyphomicrobium denitrificans]
MGPAGVSSSQRVDQWLWFARITKSRTLAQDLISRGKVRLNREKIDKPSTLVKPGDVLTLVVGPAVRSLEIVGIGHRRGPATEAQSLFLDHTPPKVRPEAAEIAMQSKQSAVRPEGSGRPTKRDRRQIDKLKGRS